MKYESEQILLGTPLCEGNRLFRLNFKEGRKALIG